MDEFDTRVGGVSGDRGALLARLTREAGGQGEDGFGEAAPGEDGATVEDGSRPVPGRRPDPVPLSFNQEQLWFLDQLAPGQPTYNIPQAMRLRGELDVEALAEALRLLVERHEALRTTFASREGTPYQVISPAGDLPLVHNDLTSLPQAEREAEATRLVMDEEVNRPFDLAAGPLFRARLIKLADDEHVLAIVVHHSVADGLSMALLNRELSEAYSSLHAGREPDLPPVPLQYADFCAWQRRWLTGEVLEGHLKFWRETLANLPTLDFPADRPRPSAPTYQGETLVYEIAADVLEPLHDLCQRSGVTPHMLLTAAFMAVVARYTGQQDIVTGAPVAGRTVFELESAVGYFVNMVVLRADLSGDPTFEEILKRVRDVCLAAWSHQDAPFERVVREVEQRRDPSRNPLFQMGIQLLPANTSGTDLVLDGLEVQIMDVSLSRARFDLSVLAMETPHGLNLRVEYSTELFERARVERFVHHLEGVLRGVAADSSLRLSELPLLSEEERRQILEEWQGISLPVPPGPLHRLLSEQAAKRPDAVAAVFEGEGMTYGELDSRSDRLARYLRSLGIRHEEVVGINMFREPDILVAIFGILKAGAAFVPLDPAFPKRRMAFILEETGARFVVTRQAEAESLPKPEGWTAVLLDRDAEAIEAGAATIEGPLEEWSTWESLAYVLYTSGTTGKPKGIVVQHDGVYNFGLWLAWICKLGAGDRMLQFSSIVFDLSEGEIFCALGIGATLVFPSRDTLVSPEALAELIRQERVTYIGAPPAMLALLEAEPYPDLRSIAVGGEAFSGELVNRWNIGDRIFAHGYGPTEISVACIFHLCEKIVWRSQPPIGRAMPNRTAYIVDAWGELAPVGVPGEIVIGGLGVTRGYLGRPDLTAERFVPDPFSAEPGARLYRSGDVGRLGPDGEIEFMGRMDTQVKLRGYRIELEEIETVLVQHPKVRRATVMLREDSPGDKRLVAYVVSNGEAPSVSELRTHLSTDLPAYMVPSAFVMLDNLPLSPTGKVDQAALPVPETPKFEASAHLMPRTPTEEGVAAAFASVLGLQAVGAQDNLFELGGSSLQAAQVVARVQETFGVKIGVRDFYATPVVSDVAAMVDAERAVSRT
jgi:amino acid adenylation domain-containing protein